MTITVIVVVEGFVSVLPTIKPYSGSGGEKTLVTSNDRVCEQVGVSVSNDTRKNHIIGVRVILPQHPQALHPEPLADADNGF